MPSEDLERKLTLDVAKPIPIFFAHANGFPGSSYHQLFKILETECELQFIDRIGHNENYPITDNWDFLVDELIDTIKAYYNAPIFGVGHSLGGVLHYFAAIKSPELYRGIILLDSPIISRAKSLIIRLIKQLGLIDRFSPGGGGTLYRRRYWSNVEEAVRYLRAKPLFQHFNEQCLLDYVHFGMQVSPQGLSLKFQPEMEHRIYQTFPHTMGATISKLKVPLALLYGQQSRTISAYDLKIMRKKINIFLEQQMLGGHMFPLEYPNETGKVILAMIKRFL